MGYKYTGRADVFVHGGKSYVRNPMKGSGDLSMDNIPISKEDALHMMEQSTLHSFELADGQDMLDAVTTPEPKK